MTLTLDTYSRQIHTEEDAIRLLYKNPELDLTKLNLVDAQQFNNASKLLYTGVELQDNLDLDITPYEFHKQNSDTWLMPIEYAELDIAKYLLGLCQTDAQVQRVGNELLMYQERNMFNLLRFLHYFITTLRNNKIVWGVGRGSSVSSYILFLLGVHKIDSIYYDLDISEFLR
jgi:DNA polymerase III alpha subunit